MLEVKLLKVIHEGIEEARKVLPFIIQADVFSKEEAALTESSAIENENNWDKLVSSGMPSFYFDTILNNFYSHVDKGQRDYLIFLDSQLFKQKVKLLYLERFKESDSILLEKYNQERIKVIDQALNVLNEGDLEGFYTKYFTGWQMHNEMIDTRDKEISKNLDLAEHSILSRYPQLSKKSKLTLVVSIGGFHSPERYMNIPHEIIDLRDLKEQDLIRDQINRAVKSGSGINDLKPLMLKVAKEEGYKER